MKGTCLGIAHKKGTYDGNDYDNYVFFVSFEADRNMLGGLACKQFKLRAFHLIEACEGVTGVQPIKDDNGLKQLIGKRLKIYADKYDVIEELFLCK